MRTFAHDTALPGGKYELGDIDPEGTAVSISEKIGMFQLTAFWQRREAYEEVGFYSQQPSMTERLLSCRLVYLLIEIKFASSVYSTPFLPVIPSSSLRR